MTRLPSECSIATNDASGVASGLKGGGESSTPQSFSALAMSRRKVIFTWCDMREGGSLMGPK